MERIEWGPELETGQCDVDGQHLGLIALFNELLEAEAGGADRLQEVFERLTEYVLVHFSCEEDLMELYDYPQAERDSHIADHNALTERTRSMVLQWRTGEMSSIAPVVNVLNDWLVHHVKQKDMALVRHVRESASEDTA